MKKIAAILCLALTAGGAFALEKTIGAGGLAGYTFSGGDLSNGDWDMGRVSYGACGFFGVSQYVEFNFGYLRKMVKSLTLTTPDRGSETYSGSDLGINDTGALHLGIYLKYPIPISDVLVFFPTAGADAEITLSSDESWWNDIWLRGGIGLDVFLSERLFLRGHVIYGAAFPFSGDIPLFKSNFGHGVLAKIGLGYML